MLASTPWLASLITPSDMHASSLKRPVSTTPTASSSLVSSRRASIAGDDSSAPSSAPTSRSSSISSPSGTSELGSVSPSALAYSLASPVTSTDSPFAKSPLSFAYALAAKYHVLFPRHHVLVTSYEPAQKDLQFEGALRQEPSCDCYDKVVLEGVAEDWTFYVYVFEHGRFGLEKEASKDDDGSVRPWGFSSPSWEQLGTYYFFNESEPGDVRRGRSELSPAWSDSVYTSSAEHALDYFNLNKKLAAV